MKLANAIVDTCNNNTRTRIHSKATYSCAHMRAHTHAELHIYARTFKNKCKNLKLIANRFSAVEQSGRVESPLQVPATAASALQNWAQIIIRRIEIRVHTQTQQNNRNNKKWKKINQKQHFQKLNENIWNENTKLVKSCCGEIVRPTAASWICARGEKYFAQIFKICRTEEIWIHFCVRKIYSWEFGKSRV